MFFRNNIDVVTLTLKALSLENVAEVNRCRLPSYSDAESVSAL